MHIKRLLSGSLAAMMVATSFNVPINVKAAEVPDTEPAAGLEENQELPSSDAEIPVDDDTNVVVEEPAVEPEVVTPEAEVVTPEAEAPVEETTEETPAEELVVEEETAEQEVVGEGTVDAILTVHFDGVEEAVDDVSDTVQVADADPITVDATVTLPVAPTKTGYIFDGWKLSKVNSEDYTGEEVKKDAGATFTYGIAANTEVTFTAQWTVDISKLDIELNGAALTFDNTDQIADVTIKSAKLNDVALGEAELNKLQLEFFSDEACETQASELKNKGDYFVKVSSTDAGYTGFKKIKVTISAKELTSEDVVLTVSGSDSGTEEAGFNLFYETADAEVTETEAAKVEGVTPKQIKPTVTIAGLTATTDFEVAYGDNNSAAGGSVKITLKDTPAAKNYSVSGTDFTESFKIVDVDESETANYTTTTRAKVSATESKPGEKTGYGTKYHKKYTKVIPAIDKSASKIKGARTTANISGLTINGVFDTEDNIKDTDIYELTKAAKEGDATKVVVTVTFKDASDSPDYEGSFVIEDSIIDDDNSEFTEHVDKASFNHGGRVYWAKANGEEAVKGSTKVTINGKEVTLDENYIYDLPQLNSTVAVGTRDSEGAFSAKSTFDYDGKAVEPAVKLLDMASPTPKEVAAENYTLSYDKNTKPGTAKVTVTMAGKYYEGSTSAEFTIAELIKAPEAPVWEFANTRDRKYEDDQTGASDVSYDTMVTLKAPTNGSSIIYTISDGTSDAATIMQDEDTRNDGVGATYTTPIKLTFDKVTSDNITINAVAVKDGKYSEEKTFTFYMLAAADDWGDVNTYGFTDFDTSNGETAIDLPKGLWISEYSLKYIGDKTTTWDENDVYDGNAKVMTGTVRIFYNNKLLTEGTDFSIAYKNNVKAWLDSDPEQYPIAKAPTITVTGKGRYAGGFTQTFEIQPQELVNDADYSLSDIGDSQIYSSIKMVAENGKIQKPKYTIKGVIKNIKAPGYKVVSLKENTDFTVDYSDIQAIPGTYTIPITFKGNYSGTATQRLEVVAAEKFLNKAKITVDTSLVNIDGSDQTKNVKLTVKLGDVELKEGVDFNASYYYETLPYYSYDDTVTSYNSRYKVQSAGKYAVSIYPVDRTDGGVQYAGEKFTTFTVKGGKAVSNAKLVSVDFDKSVEFENGFNTFIVKDVELNKTLTKGEDYEIVYSKTPAVGTVKATIYGLGAYSGTKAVSYTVKGTKLTAKDNLVFTKKNFEYTGSDISPYNVVSNSENFKIVVKSTDESVEDKTLVLGINYEITGVNSNADFKKVGTKSFTVKGIGAYTGSFKVSYKIDPFDITADQAKYAVPTEAEPTPINTNKLKFGYQEGLSWSTDKVVGYKTESFTNVGELPEIRFSGNYCDSKFIKDNFTFTYSKDKTPGKTVTVTVKGKKNFKGTATMQYVVEEADISDASLVSIFVPDKQVGKWAAPKVTIKNILQNKALAEGAKKDYTVRYTYAKQTTVANGKEKDIKRYIGDDVVKGDVISTATQIKATFTGVNRYTGTVEKYINVVAKANDIATGTFKIANKQYNDGDVTLDTADFTTAEIKSGKTVTKLTYGTDFVIDSYAKNDKVGTASVTLHGIGSYAGYKTVTFKITAKNMNYNVKFVAAPKGDDNVALTVTGATKDAANKTVNSIKLPKSGFKAVDAQKNAYIFAYWKDDQGNKWYPNELYVAEINGRDIDPGEYATLEAHFVKANKDAKLNITYKPGTVGAALSGKGYEDKKQTVSQGKSVTLLADNAYKVPGYTLIGWKLDNTTSYSPKEVLYNAEATAKDITLTAVWYKHTYYINYIENGGEFATTPTESFAVDTPDITLPTNITRTGYTFAGWKNAKGKVVTKIEKGTVGDQKLTAQWTATENAFKVTFAKNATEVALNTSSKLPDAIQFTPGKAVKIPADKLVAANDQFTFVGWSDEDKADTPKYKPNANVKFTGNVTLYPVWKESDYTITYVPNGGKLTGTYAKTFTKATSSTVTLATPTMLGKKFDGWEAVENVKNGAKVELTGTAPSQKLPANLTKNVRLTAKWAPDEASVKVTFNANGGAGTAPEQQTITAVGAALTANVFTRDNYEFKGWATSASDETVTYNDGQVVTAGELGTDTTFYAVWEPELYWLNYKTEIPFRATATPIRVYSFGSTESLPTDDGNTFVAHDGYEFDGWYEVGSSSITTIPEGATKVDALKNTDNKDRFFIAKWDKTEYTITLTLDSGSLSEADATAWANKKYTVEDSVTLPTPTRTGYTFAGWTGTDLEKATTSVTIPTGTTGNKAYTATWTPDTPSITYYLDGGSWATSYSAPATYTVGDTAATTLPVEANISKDADEENTYAFAGWVVVSAESDDVSSGTTITAIPTDSTSALKLKAKWTATAKPVEP